MIGGYGSWTPAASKAKPLMDAKVRHRDPKKELHDVPSLIGACNFYHRHIKKFTYISAILTDLIKESTPGAGALKNNKRLTSSRTKWVTESFIVISTLCVCCASPAACCWCRVSCCLFVMRKMFYLLKYNQSRITQARDKQVEENQGRSIKGCSVNSERCKNIDRNCNSGHIGLHIHKDS